MEGPKRIALMIASLAITMGMMAVMLAWGTSPSDTTLLALSAVVCLLVLVWAAIGAPQVPQIWVVPVMIPAMMVGMGLLLSVSERHPALSPIWVGAGAAAAFLALGCCVTWLVAHLRSEGRTGEGPDFAATLVITGMVFLFGGVLFFQPLVLAINAQRDARPPLVLSGTIANLYETRGKHTSYYVDFSGPAAAWGNTLARGEFEISGKAYDTMHRGDRECLTIHTGLLHLDWWTIDDCGRGAQIAAILKLWQQGQHAAAIASLETLVRDDPHTLDALTPEWIVAARRAMAAQHDIELTGRLLAMLASPRWAPADQDLSSDGYRYDYALFQASSNDSAAAAATLATVENPVLQMQATLDPRLRGIMPATFDARAVVDQAIVRQRAAMAEYPNALGPVLKLARLYLLLDDGQAVVNLMQGSKPGVDHPHMQASTTAQWQWWADLAQGYLMLGRYDDALHALRASMGSGQANEHNRAFLLNIAGVQLDFGHPGDALTTLAALDPRPDDWGDAQEAFWRRDHACAATATGGGNAAQADVTWLREHGLGKPGMLFSALLCTGHEEEAAAMLINDLRNPNASVAIRLQLSTFAPLPAGYPGDATHRGLARLANRPDVAAAVRDMGGAGNFDIPPP